MKKQTIQSPDAPQAIGTYSQAIRVNGGDTVYLSGQIGLDPSTMQMVVGVEGQIQQVFLNLISNAIEAMSSVTGRTRDLRIRSFLVQELSEVVVTVEDSGIGIEGHGSKQIFEPFFTTKSTGTGVGLTICRVIVEAHGGSLQASTNKPYGAVFQVTLPSADL